MSTRNQNPEPAVEAVAVPGRNERRVRCSVQMLKAFLYAPTVLKLFIEELEASDTFDVDVSFKVAQALARQKSLEM